MAISAVLAAAGAAQSAPFQPAYSEFQAEPAAFRLPEAVLTYGDEPGAADASRLVAALMQKGLKPGPEAVRLEAAVSAAFQRSLDPEAGPPAGDYGDLALSFPDPRTAVLKDAAGQTVASLGPHRDLVTAAARDGDVFATAGRDRAVRVLRRDPAFGTWSPIGFASGLSGNRNWIRATAVRADGAVTRVAAGDVDGRLVSWRIDSRGPVVETDEVAHQATVIGCWFVTTGDGEAILTTGADGVARLTPLIPPGTPDLQPVPTHDQDVRAAVFTPDGAILSAGVDQRLIEHGREPLRGSFARATPLAGSIVGVAVSSDGAMAAAATAEGLVFIFPRKESAASSSLRARRLDVKIGAMAFRPGTHDVFLGCGDGRVRVVGPADDADCYELDGGHRLEVKGLAFDAAGDRLVSAGADNTVMVRRFAADGRQTFAAPLRLKPPVDGFFGHWHACAFSPDGKKIAAGALSALVAIWDAETGEALHVLRGHEGSVEGVAWSPDGARLLSTAADGHVCVWSAAKGELIARVRAGPLTIYSAAYDPDGRSVATAGQDGTVRLFSAESFRPLRTIGGAPHVRDVAMAPDGVFFAAAYDDGVRLFDLDGPRLLAHWPTPTPPETVAFAADGALVVVADAAGGRTGFEVSSGLRAEDDVPLPVVPTAAPTPDARLLVERFGRSACPRFPVYAFDEGGPAAERAALFAENSGVVRVVRRSASATGAATTRVYEFAIHGGGAWSVRESRPDDGRTATLVRADDGGRFAADPRTVDPAPPPAGQIKAEAKLSLRVPESLTIAPGESLLAEVVVVNDGATPAFVLSVLPFAVRDVSVHGIDRVSRLDPGATAVLRVVVERRAAPARPAATASSPAASAETAPLLLEFRVRSANGEAQAAGLVRTP